MRDRTLFRALNFHTSIPLCTSSGTAGRAGHTDRGGADWSVAGASLASRREFTIRRRGEAACIRAWTSRCENSCSPGSRHACQTQRWVACMHALVHACMPSACMHHMHAGIIPSYDPDGTTTCMHAFAVAFACEYRVHVFKTSGCMPSCHACMHVIGAAFPVPRSAVQCIRPYVRFPLAFSSPCLRCLSRQTSAGFMSYVHWPNALA